MVRVEKGTEEEMEKDEVNEFSFEYMDIDNVTKVRPRPKANSLGNLVEGVSMFESTRISIPHSNFDTSGLNSTLHEKIRNLEIKLSSANNEIENLILENEQKTKELERCRKLTDMYKKIEYGDPTPSLSRKRKRQRISMVSDESQTPRRTSAVKNVDHQQFEYERQQEIIQELNNRVQELQQWLDEERKKKCKTGERRTIYNRQGTVCVNIKKKTGKSTMIRKLKNVSKKIKSLQNECQKLKEDNEKLIQQITKWNKGQLNIITKNEEPDIEKGKENMKNVEDQQDHIEKNTLHTSFLNNEHIESASCRPSCRSSAQQVHILGDQQIKGLSKRLHARRNSHKGSPCTIMTILKPDATSQQILNSCDGLQTSLKENDVVILAVGSNDKNPYVLFRELEVALYKLRKCKVFLANVLYNPYLNIELLNYNLKFISRNHENCSFIETNNINKDIFLTELCHKLSVEIDYLSYENKYLKKKHNKFPLQTKHSTDINQSVFNNNKLKARKLTQKLISDFIKPNRNELNSNKRKVTNVTQKLISDYFEKSCVKSNSSNSLNQLFRK